MSFAVGAGAYDRFMGRYSTPLAPVFAGLAGVEVGARVLDVGCGPGALTTELARIARPEAVAAVDPSPAFVEAARERNPGVEVRHGSAESLPYADGAFDAALAQLVVHFMPDPAVGLREMRRVTRAGGTVAACVWDHAGGAGPLARFWEAARGIDPAVEDESRLPGARKGDLERLFVDAGAARCRGAAALRRGRASELRRVVGAVHARCRPCRGVRDRARRRPARAVARALPRALLVRPLRGPRGRVGGARVGLSGTPPR
ncbi:MAG: class I SAM-dependent methyltransferase [Gaiella sp.]|nr:class I SAM-dependent methyltransferase [Gaiella sp.]